ncbi:hypothetical protein ACFQMA_06395 [Halosimplex aquaticum]|uniref:Major facilitator superfamily (MFS) profile domain-containing protein n=1 Tax=Halosimplex aquaticum TaxID=3026162 RepID=A0ABD5Y0W3_9EURY|nr:hypothetical protein [Halosimplex aquaticum]
MTQYVSTDYPSLAKTGFLLGVSLFALGAAGELVGTAVLGGVPGWEQTLFFDMEVLGILLGLFSPLVFGIVLPLVE